MKISKAIRCVAAWTLALVLAGCAASGSNATSPAASTQSTATNSSQPAQSTSQPSSKSPPDSSPTVSAPVGGGATPVLTTNPAPTSDSSDWPTYHRDNLRTGYLPNIPDPQALAVAWTAQLDGAVYAEPLVVGGHVIAATENDTIYSLDARTGQVAWQTHIGEPVSRADLPCGNISPLGITGTPVYDPASKLVFAVAEVSGLAHFLIGLDVNTGQLRVRRPTDPQGMDPVAHQQRAALALANGMVYVAYGGLYGDCGDYHGWVVASRTDGSGPVLTFQVPTNREGGIWAPAGPAIDSQGRLFVSVGNGDAVVGNWDHSDSVLRLSPTLELEDGFAPSQWGQDNLMDADLGSLGPVLMPGNSIFIAGKAGIGYLLNSEALGGIGGQVLSQDICHAYGGAAVVGSTAFVPCNEGVQQIQAGPGAKLTAGWRADGIPGSPVVGGHTIYTLDRQGMLYALVVGTGSQRAKVNVGAASRFATPTLYQTQIFVGTLSGITAVAIS